MLCASRALRPDGCIGRRQPFAPRSISKLRTWNRGDLTQFATAYKDSPDILFIGSKISRGYAQMLERYRTVYSTTRERWGRLPSAMSKCSRSMTAFATATGKFHLARTAAGGGDASGSYMLVFEKTPQGWKIIRDVTIPAPKP